MLCERCQAQGAFIRWLVNDCGIPAPAIVQTRSYQVITGYTVRATVEEVIVGYEQECACGKVQDKN